MKHSKTSRTLKTVTSSQYLNHATSKRILSRPIKIISERLNTQKMSSPQKRLRNLCNIEQSILHNIYDLKQQKPNQKQFASVNRYQQLLLKIVQVQEQLKSQRNEQQQLKGKLQMIKQDQASRQLQSIDLMCENQELQQILDVYSKRFPDESKILIEMINVDKELSKEIIELTKIDTELQDLDDNLLSEDLNTKTSEQTNYLDRKIHDCRLKLLEIEQKINLVCQNIVQPHVRQILCHFYLQNKELQNATTDGQQIGIQLWICKNSFVNIFDNYIFNNYSYLKQQGKQHYQQYIQVLTKIQMNYVQIYRLTTMSEQDINQQNKQLYEQKKNKYTELDNKVAELKQKKQGLQIALKQILHNEQLFRLQLDLGKFQTKILVKEFKIEQDTRVANIKKMVIRTHELNEFMRKGNNKNMDRFKIQQIQELLRLKKQEINSLQSNLDKLNKFSAKSNTKTQITSEYLSVQIQALQKKLRKLQSKKHGLINSKYSQTPNNEQKQPFSQLHLNMISPFSTKKKLSNFNSKSAKKPTKSVSSYQTITVRPYQPLDKAITKLATFKKTLANDKVKLNKALSKLIKKI